MVRRSRELTIVDSPLARPHDALARAALWKWRGAVALIHGLILGSYAVNALFRPRMMYPNLYIGHAGLIERSFSSPLEPGLAHFLWHGTSKLSTALVGAGDVRVGAAIVSVAAYMLFGVCLFEVFRQLDDGPLSPLWATLASLGIALLETPAALQGWEAIVDPRTSFLALYLGFIPTSVASLGFNVLMVWFASRLLMGDLAATARRWLPPVVIAASLAKPNLVAPLTAAVAALSLVARYSTWSLWGMRLDRDSFPSVLRLIVVPTVAVTIFQDYLIRYRNHEAIRGGWVLDPLSEMSDLGAFGWQFWLVLTFPIAAVVLLRRRLIGDVAVTISFGALLVGIVLSLLLARSNPTYQGDVLQLCQASAAMLMVFIPRRLVTLGRQGQVRPAVAVALTLVLIPYAVAGAATWRCQSGIVECYPTIEPPPWPQPSIEGK